MRLHLMRHGPAEDRALSGRDFDRVLTSAGRGVVEGAARQFHAARAAHGSGAHLRVLTSPFRRAVETARIVTSLAPPPAMLAEEVDELGADAEVMPLALVARLSHPSRLSHGAASDVDALLVGHQPTIEALARELASGPLSLPMGFRTAMIVTLERGSSETRSSHGFDLVSIT